MAEINDLDIVDANNTARFPEGMAAATVNDSGRALEGIIARWQKDTNASITAGGTGNVITVAANQTLSAYYDGLVLAFEATAANTGAATLNADAVAAAPIVKHGATALAANDIKVGQKVIVVYDGANWQMISQLGNAPPAGDVVGPASATANSLARFDGTTGKLLKDGAVIGTDVQAYDSGISTTPLIQGKHTVGLGAGGIFPATTNGCAALAQGETTTNKVNYKYLAFDPTSIEYAHFDFPSPKSYNASTMTFYVEWAHPATTTNFGVVWTLELLALADDDALDTAWGTGVDLTDTGGTTGDIYQTAESSAVTPGNTAAKKDRIFARISRKATDGSDTLAVDAHLIGVTILYTNDAGDDS